MLPIIYHSIYSELPLPPQHRYPISKYKRLHQAVNEQMNQELESGCIQLIESTALTVDEVKKVHCSDYIDLLTSGQLAEAKMRRIGFPWSEQLIRRTLTSAGGTVATAELAIEHGFAIHLSGGYHHAHFDFGSGFCLINDLALAAFKALEHPDVDKVLIIDSDVHHGDGTATLCQNMPDVVTLSFHCGKNFPARKPDSDIDIDLNREVGDQEFLTTFKSVVETAINLHQPDLVIYDAGVDIHIDDELGYLNVSTDGIYQRDYWLLNHCLNRHLPVGCVVGGGYRTDHQDLVEPHMQLIRAAAKVLSERCTQNIAL
ncbi:histone deacetylase [Vibrio maerlii]|uniref:histone deacetylase family protein n=1 Tax=Vibrio maerlii TaxID=2231648 RepID=UPI000E3E5938|nr:histone deacetylase [Vibrio maerlii]